MGFLLHFLVLKPRFPQPVGKAICMPTEPVSESPVGPEDESNFHPMTQAPAVRGEPTLAWGVVPGAVAMLSRDLSLLGGVDKPVAGGARTCSVGGQLLLEPLTPSPRRFWSLFCTVEVGLGTQGKDFTSELQTFVLP